MNDKTQTDIMTRERRRQELGETEFGTGSQGGALMQPTNGKQLMDMANMMSASKTMIRDFYRDSPGDCAALIMICQPYGFNPYQVSWKTYKASKSADAPVSFEGQLVNAMVNMSAPIRGRLKYAYVGEGPTRQCIVVGVDRETGDPIDYTSPMLKDIPIKNSPLWKGDPDQQLGYYSARAWARRHFPELLLGVYTREEIEEAPSIRDVTPESTGGWANKARAAREPEQADPKPDIVDTASTDDGTDEIEDATILPEDEGHWTDDVATDEGMPGSQSWTDGMQAFHDQAPVTDCPHEDDMEAAQDWMGGWHGAQKAAE